MFKLDLSQSSPEVRGALIEAVSRVFSAGLMASNSTLDDHRIKSANTAVDAFIEKLDSLNK